MHAYYAARAPEYDRIYLKPERQPDLRAIEAWLPTVVAGRSVLELACGTGYWTQFIAPVAARVLAIDAAVETLQIARERTLGGSVDFVTGDAYALPAQAQGFDAAFAGFWFSHVPKSRVAEFLAGLHRALVPGARVVFLDNLYVEGNSTPVCERDAEGNTYQMRTLADGSTHQVLKNFPTEGELREAMRGLAGELRHHAWKYYWALEYTVA
ncbi:class I SAM-dependent methyltransferase [Ramlibacter alkalitolerans]|uniref:Class I SAM-dependent methyltransferase n=1 Tax=Ramlibacter alkalitolerans TaxID=2039631 RepID=A0ABS1JIR1_9BURK|nr:class I SAM-dependent methyltransferase [Ramlibacter alkalitolerans]MBL0424113.1 class I SAM-dependent methyltransferase [Ramlibacter alkalitolerans]